MMDGGIDGVAVGIGVGVNKMDGNGEQVEQVNNYHGLEGAEVTTTPPSPSSPPSSSSLSLSGEEGVDPDLENGTTLTSTKPNPSTGSSGIRRLEDLADALTVARDTALDKRASAREYSLSPSTSSKRSTRHQNETTFVETLMAALEDDENADVLSWMPDGRSFSIVDTKKFASTKMPELFKVRVLSSFTRKLSQWGFNRGFDRKSLNSDIYSHRHFQRGRPDRLAQMRNSTHRTAVMGVPVVRPVPPSPGSDQNNIKTFLDGRVGDECSNITVPRDALQANPPTSKVNLDSACSSDSESTAAAVAVAAAAAAVNQTSTFNHPNWTKNTTRDPNNPNFSTTPIVRSPQGHVMFQHPSSMVNVNNGRPNPSHLQLQQSPSCSSIDVAISSLLQEREKLLKDTNSNALALKALMEQRERYHSNSAASVQTRPTHNNNNNNNNIFPPVMQQNNHNFVIPPPSTTGGWNHQHGALPSMNMCHSWYITSTASSASDERRNVHQNNAPQEKPK